MYRDLEAVLVARDLEAARPGDRGLERVPIGGRVRVLVLVVGEQRLGHERGGRLGVGVLRLRALVDEHGEPDRGEDGQDQQDHQDLDKCEPALGPQLHDALANGGQGRSHERAGGQSADRPPAASTSRAITRAASGRARRAEAPAIAARRAVSATSASTSTPQPLRRELGVGQHGGGARALHPARVRLLVVAGRVRIRDQDRGQAVLGELEHRPAGARDRQVGRRQRGAERHHVVAQDVMRAGRRERGEVPPSRHVQDPVRRVREGAHGGLVDRPRAERAAEHEHGGLALLEAEPGPRAGAVGDGRRDRAAGHQVALSAAALDREGQADAARAGGEQAVGQAEVGVGLGEHERGPAQDGREAHRPGGVAAAAHDRVGAVAAQEPAGGEQGGARLGDSADGLERVAARDPFDVQRVELVAGGGHQLGLGALPAGEADLGALSPQRVGDRDRRYDVPRRPAGRDQDANPAHARPRSGAGGPSRRRRCSAAAPSRTAARRATSSRTR